MFVMTKLVAIRSIEHAARRALTILGDEGVEQAIEETLGLKRSASLIRKCADPDDDEYAGARRGQYGGYGQPPVIVVTGAPQTPNNAQNPYLFNPPAAMAGMPHDASLGAREFKVVGEREEWIDEYGAVGTYVRDARDAVNTLFI